MVKIVKLVAEHLLFYNNMKHFLLLPFYIIQNRKNYLLVQKIVFKNINSSNMHFINKTCTMLAEYFILLSNFYYKFTHTYCFTIVLTKMDIICTNYAFSPYL